MRSLGAIWQRSVSLGIYLYRLWFSEAFQNAFIEKNLCQFGRLHVDQFDQLMQTTSTSIFNINATEGQHEVF